MSFPALPSLPGTPTQITIGQGGYVVVDPHLYVTSWNNQFVWDLTPYMTNIKVTHNPSRLNGQWILESEITYEGWKYLHPFSDWLSPVLRVIYADGSEKINQLGHYILLDSPEHREETGGTVRLDARDALWALWAQGLATVFIAPTGTNGPTAAVGAAVMSLVNNAIIPGNARSPIFDHFRNTLTPYGFDVGIDWLIFEEGSRVLDAANAMLTGTNRQPLTTRNDGFIFTEQKGFINIWPPVRTWYANPPLSGSFPVGALTVNPSLAERKYSPIAQYIDTVPMTADLVDEVTIIGNIATDVIGKATRARDFTKNASFPPLGPGGGGSDPKPVGGSPSPLPPLPAAPDDSETFGGIRKTYVVRGLTSNQNAANYAAAAILEKLLTENTNATLFVEADPTFVSYYNTIDLAIWDANGDPIVNGRYAVNQVQYGFMPEDSLMRIEISKLPPYTPTFHASS